MCRSIHIARRSRRTILKNSLLNSNRFDSHILNAFFVRHASTNDTKEVPEVIRVDLTNHATVNKDDQLFEIPGNSWCV